MFETVFFSNWTPVLIVVLTSYALSVAGREGVAAWRERRRSSDLDGRLGGSRDVRLA